MSDLALALRLLRRNPIFTVCSILILALAIAGITAGFSAVHVLLLERLPFADATRLIVVSSRQESTLARAGVSGAQFADWVEQAPVFESAAAIQLEQSFSAIVERDPVRLTGGRMTADLLPLLGMPPLLGRPLLPDDQQPGAPLVVLLTERYWTDTFGRDERVIGRRVVIDGEPATIVGILPADFRLLYGGYALWAPLRIDRARADRADRSLLIVARLRPDVSLTESVAALNAVTSRLQREFPETDAGWQARVLPMREFLLAGRRNALVFVAIAASLLLVIACANVAGLQLARAVRRQREIAVRLALGGSRARIIRMLLADAGIVAAGSGVLGLALVASARRLLLAGSPDLRELTISGPVLGFTLAVTATTAIASGLVPALTATRLDLSAVLRGVVSKRRSTSRLRSSLVVAELFASGVLLVPAGLLYRSFQALREVDPGFEAANVLTISVAPPPGISGDPARTLAFYDTVVERLQALPGIRSVAAADALPLEAPAVSRVRLSEVGVATRSERTTTAHVRTITTDYLQTFEIPLKAGRSFTRADDRGSPRVAIINETLAAAIPAGGGALGTTIEIGQRGSAVIVGVVSDIRSVGLRTPPAPEVLVPLAQHPRPSMVLALAAASEPARQIAAVRQTIRALDPGLATGNPTLMADILDEQVRAVRVIATLLASLAALALVLAIAGLSGIMSWAVTERTREVGIRAALGATRPQLVLLLMRHGLTLLAVGLVLGLPAAAGVARLVSSTLWGVSAADLAVFVGVPAVLALAACAACFIPAWRVTGLAPATDLRAE